MYSELCIICKEKHNICRHWTDDKVREFETRVEYFVTLVGGKDMDLHHVDRPVPVDVTTNTAPLGRSLREGLNRLRDRTKTLSFKRQPQIGEEPSLVAEMEEQYRKAVSEKAFDRRVLKSYPHPLGPPVRLEMTRKLQQLDDAGTNNRSESANQPSNELYAAPGPKPPLGVSSWSLGQRTSPGLDRVGRACSTPAAHSMGGAGENKVGRSSGARNKSQVSLAEELGILRPESRAGEVMLEAGMMTHPLRASTSAVILLEFLINNNSPQLSSKIRLLARGGGSFCGKVR